MSKSITQTEFEQLLGRGEPMENRPEIAVVYFTARWCTACRSVDMTRLSEKLHGVVFYKCDVDENDYTAGYCGIRSIPSFALIRKQKMVGTLTSNKTDEILSWILGHIA